MALVQIDKLLETVVKEGVSDLHIVVGQPPVVRLGGRMVRLDTKTLEPDDTVSLMKSITPERNQQELQETGSSDFGFAFGDKARFRVSVFKQKGKISLVLRRIPNEFLSPEVIGLPPVCLELIQRPRGLFLVTGPTGSGKTTSLASMINWMNHNMDHHIITLEDPIEYYHEHLKCTINQREIGTDCPTFAEALRRALRQDPDVVMVGEIRDLETAEIAVQASLTGHLVLSTLHTNTAIGAVTRLQDMGVEPFLLSSSLLAVMAQRLVRLLCLECREPYQPGEAERERLGLTNENVQLYRARGCSHCNMTGYRGRTGIYELIEIGEALREAIHGGQGEQSLLRLARQQSPGIDADGRRRIISGETSLEEVLRVTAVN